MQAKHGASTPAAVAVGLVVAVATVAVPWACGGNALQLSSKMQCRLHTLDVLPEDPKMATVYDAVDVIERLRACERLDGGL